MSERSRATRTSFEHAPFVSGELFPCALEFTREEFERIALGFVPQSMDDKWFVFFEEPHLHFHRSWTGDPIYRLTFAVQGDGALVSEFRWCTQNQGGPKEAVYECRLVDFLIRNLLLDERKPFPTRPGDAAYPPGVLQHSVAGTAYPEQPVEPPEDGMPKPRDPRACPICGAISFTLRDKLRLTPRRTIACRACGGSVSVSRAGFYALLLWEQMVLTAAALAPLMMDAGIVATTLVLTLGLVALGALLMWGHAWLIELEAR